MIAISGAGLLRLYAEKFTMSITACAEWRYTLWTSRIVTLCNCWWRSEVLYYWSWLVQSWSLLNKGSLRVEVILRRLGIVWTSEESSVYFGELKGKGHMLPFWTGQILTTTDAPRSFDCKRLQTRSRKSEVSRRSFNALSSSWCFWADEHLDHKCGSSGFNYRL